MKEIEEENRDLKELVDLTEKERNVRLCNYCLQGLENFTKRQQTHGSTLQGAGGVAKAIHGPPPEIHPGLYACIAEIHVEA